MFLYQLLFSSSLCVYTRSLTCVQVCIYSCYSSGTIALKKCKVHLFIRLKGTYSALELSQKARENQCMHLFLYLDLLYVSVCVPSQAVACVWRSEDKLRSWFSLPTVCVLGNKLSHQFQWQAPLPVSHLAGCLVMFVCVCMMCVGSAGMQVCHNTRVEVREQLLEISSLFP